MLTPDRRKLEELGDKVQQMSEGQRRIAKDAITLFEDLPEAKEILGRYGAYTAQDRLLLLSKIEAAERDKGKVVCPGAKRKSWWKRRGRRVAFFTFLASCGFGAAEVYLADCRSSNLETERFSASFFGYGGKENECYTHLQYGDYQEVRGDDNGCDCSFEHLVLTDAGDDWCVDIKDNNLGRGILKKDITDCYNPEVKLPYKGKLKQANAALVTACLIKKK